MHNPIFAEGTAQGVRLLENLVMLNVNNEFRKVFFIVNKFSGSGFQAEMEQTFKRTCEAREWEFGLAYTQAPGHASTLATEALHAGYKKIVAVGGDGTINEVARSLVHTPAAMGIIPKGSGNGLARHLRIPMKVTDALECLFTSKVIPIDTFRLNDKLSLNVSGIGFDGFVAGLFGGEKQRGFRGYTKLVLSEFMTFPEFEASITSEGRTLTTTQFVIAIANSTQYGNNAKIAPAASVCDGLLDISIVKKFPAYRLDFIYSFFSGTIHQSEYCETFQVRDVSVQLRAPMAFHIDGEPAGTTDYFKVGIDPASLNMLAPHESNKV